MLASLQIGELTFSATRALGNATYLPSLCPLSAFGR